MRVCFNCGKSFTGDGEVCDDCSQDPQEEKKSGFGFSILITKLVDLLGVVMAIILM